jgi:hypothetical protein
MCAEDFIRLVTAEVKKMSEKEKAEFRRGWIRKTPNFFRPGDEVTVSQFNGKLLKGQITAVFDSVSGRRIRVIAGSLVLNVGEDQVQLIGVKK